ncbi:MAG: 2-hydroxyacid dehydrogenase [Actinomycetes bacterium]
MAKIVVTGKIPEVALEKLKKSHEVISWGEETPISRDEMLKRVPGANVIVSLLTEKIDEEVLTSAGNDLKAVCNVAVGYNNIDVAACKNKNVLVTNTPGVLTDATADIAMALILMTTRRLSEGERVIRKQEPWAWGMFYMLGSSIQNQTLGILGMGQIGIATALRAKSFGMKIIYTRRNRLDEKIEKELSAQYVSLDELLQQSDIVSLHCPYSTETHHLISDAQLSKMKKTSYLINTARGPIVNEEALANALINKTIAGAGLDVYENEPKVNEKLLKLDNVVLLPHLGSATVETRTAMATTAANNALEILSGNKPLNPVY